MAIIALPVFVVLFVFALKFPHGVNLPGNITFDIFGYFFKSDPSPSDLLWENYCLWILLYTTAHFLFYSEPIRRYFKAAKFNPSYPPKSLVAVEFLRSARGVLICSLYEMIFYVYIAQPWYRHWSVEKIIPSTFTAENIDTVGLITSALLVYLWGDFHFYWTHRMLHTSWLYKNVHKYHHESFNPDPFSGLSMHPFESAVYFSAALLLGLAGCPAWLVRLNFKGLLIFPLEGHSGYGSWEIESSNNHYVHHSKFNWNYGSSPLWDHLCGTNFVKKQKKTGGMSDREKEAMKQAALVGCDVAQGERAPSKLMSSE